MKDVFEVCISSGEVLKGRKWTIEEPKANLVMMTGMQEYAGRYDSFAKWFNKKGFDIYCLDAFGQGLNVDRIEDLQKWPKDAFAKNVEGIYEMLKLAEKSNGLTTHIFAHSMGSFMLQSFLERYPNEGAKKVICGSNGPNAALFATARVVSGMVVNKDNWDKPCPFLNNMATGGYGKGIKNRKTDLDWISYNEENVSNYIADPYCGVVNTGGFMREFLIGMDSLYRKEALSKISQDEKLFIIAGKEDPVGECGKGVERLFKMYKDLGVKDVQLKIYDGMRHEIHNEKDNLKVYQDILSFLAE